MRTKVLVLLAVASLFANVGHAKVVTCTNCMTSAQGMAVIGLLTAGFPAVTQAIQGNATSVSNAVTAASQTLSEAQVKTEAEFTKKKAEIDYEPLDPCATTALAQKGKIGGKDDPMRSRPRSFAKGTGAGKGLSSSNKPLADAIDVSMGAKIAPSPQAHALALAAGGCKYASNNGNKQRSKMCDDAQLGTDKTDFPDADVRAETLFDGPQEKKDELVRKLTIKKDSKEEAALFSFLRNVTSLPVELRTLEKGEVNTIAGQQYMALRDSFDAQMSLATKMIRDWASMMIENKATAPIIDQLMKGEDADFISNYLKEATGGSKEISILDLIILEGDRRYRNPKWHERMAKASERQLLSELVNISAAQLWMTAQLLERTHQLGMVTGVMASSHLRQERLPEVVAAHRAAQR